MKRIFSWLAQIRADNVHIAIFGITILSVYVISFGLIIGFAIVNSGWNLLWFFPWFISAIAGILFVADFSEGGDRRDHTYNIDVLSDFYDLERRYLAVKKERDRLHLLRHTRTL